MKNFVKINNWFNFSSNYLEVKHDLLNTKNFLKSKYKCIIIYFPKKNSNFLIKINKQIKNSFRRHYKE